MTTRERIIQLGEAIELIQEARDLVDEALNDTKAESHYKAYNKYGMNQLLGNGNPYDISLYELKQEFEDLIYEEENQEEHEETQRRNEKKAKQGFIEAGKSSGFDMRGI